jgi:hypothetical protein
MDRDPDRVILAQAAAVPARGAAAAEVEAQGPGANVYALSAAQGCRTNPVRPAVLCPAQSAALPWFVPSGALSKYIPPSQSQNGEQ